MKKTILLVEDEAQLRLGLCIDLESHGGYEVWEASDHPEALFVLEKRGVPHLIITDVMMPSGKQAGLDLITEVKSHPQWKDIPIIVLSARTAADDILEALRRGASDYLVKPCELKDLLERTNRAYKLSCQLASAAPSSETRTSQDVSHSRKLHVDTLKLALWYWELTTQKTKVDLADESGLWSTYLNESGSYSARTLNSYLQESTLPKKPKTLQILQTALYVLKHCPEEPALKLQLEAYIEELKQLP